MQIFEKTALFCCLLFVTCLSGCGPSKEETLVGKWKVHLPENVKNNAEIVRVLGPVSFDFNADKTYALNYGTPTEGIWSVDQSGRVTLTMTRRMGQDVAALSSSSSLRTTGSCQLIAGNKTLIYQPPNETFPQNEVKDPVYFEKE